MAEEKTVKEPMKRTASELIGALRETAALLREREAQSLAPVWRSEGEDMAADLEAAALMLERMQQPKNAAGVVTIISKDALTSYSRVEHNGRHCEGCTQEGYPNSPHCILRPPQVQT